MPTTADVKIVKTDADIARCFPVMAVLRPHLIEADFVARVRRMERESGWTLIYVEDKGSPVAVSGFRISDYLYSGKTLYVDDLIALESHRGLGFAEALMAWMEETARRVGCQTFSLDSGTHRLGAHRFYHRLKMGISAFHFQKLLNQD
jgi:GNAT superfamily N-acetyltransferase